MFGSLSFRLSPKDVSFKGVSQGGLIFTSTRFLWDLGFCTFLMALVDNLLIWPATSLFLNLLEAVSFFSLSITFILNAM